MRVLAGAFQTKPGAALARRQGRLPWQGRGWFPAQCLGRHPGVRELPINHLRLETEEPLDLAPDRQRHQHAHGDQAQEDDPEAQPRPPPSAGALEACPPSGTFLQIGAIDGTGIQWYGIDWNGIDRRRFVACRSARCRLGHEAKCSAQRRNVGAGARLRRRTGYPQPLPRQALGTSGTPAACSARSRRSRTPHSGTRRSPRALRQSRPTRRFLAPQQSPPSSSTHSPPA
jgi:hypothetical protein